MPAAGFGQRGGLDMTLEIDLGGGHLDPVGTGQIEGDRDQPTPQGGSPTQTAGEQIAQRLDVETPGRRP